MNTNIILNELLKGNINIVICNKTQLISQVMTFLNSDNSSIEELDNIYNILKISNILYNNTSLDFLLLEDGVYDLLLEKYKIYRNDAPVGAEPVYFDNIDNNEEYKKEDLKDSIILLDRELMYDELLNCTNYNKNRNYLLNNVVIFNDNLITKRNRDTSHVYPKLVGTLDKCKFVMSYQARDKGVYDEPNVTILERDFFGKHIMEGIITQDSYIRMCIELKYDGISIEHDLTTNTFRSRGDAINNIAADLTPILSDYIFNDLPEINEPLGIKYEAIMTYSDLIRYNMDRNNNYKNCRTAISSLFDSSDARRYLDYITLVPLQTSMDIDRITEIEFLNKYFTKGIPLTYAIIEGTYDVVLYQIKQFVEEAEYMRPFLPFMYDGVVVSYIDKDIIEKLGRVNAVNKYSIAVKFNPMKKSTIFTGYSYTIGQTGIVTPMIHYEPVEFYGTIHNKSSGHSFARFKELNLKIGDIIDVEYVNDVMPYVTKPENSYNLNNNNEYEKFIEYCPYCGTKLIISESGKTVICNNKSCDGRKKARMVTMLQRLSFRDFAEASVEMIDIYSFYDLMNLTENDLSALGEITTQKLLNRINEIKSNHIKDYEIIGALGFTNMANRTWKLIFEHITLREMMNIYNSKDGKNILFNIFTNIKGIGKQKAITIIDEILYFINDITYILNNINIIDSKNNKSENSKKIRVTGFRNKLLEQQLIDMGHDISDGSVTKDTDILLVPSQDHKSSKVDKAIKYGVKIIPVNDFVDYMENYI